jgi:hypothetical protein
MGPAPDQAQLRDFAIPQRGAFVVGRTFSPEPHTRSPLARCS